MYTNGQPRDLLSVFEDGKVNLKINKAMKSQASTVAIIMDQHMREWKHSDDIFRNNSDYKVAFALLVKYASTENPELKFHNIKMEEHAANMQFKDNMKLLVIDELAGLIKKEAEALKREDPEFIVLDRYAPFIRTGGDIPRIEHQDVTFNNEPEGSPSWAAKGFAIDIYNVEHYLYEAIRAQRDGRPAKTRS